MEHLGDPRGAGGGAHQKVTPACPWEMSVAPMRGEASSAATDDSRPGWQVAKYLHLVPPESCTARQRPLDMGFRARRRDSQAWWGMDDHHSMLPESCLGRKEGYINAIRVKSCRPPDADAVMRLVLRDRQDVPVFFLFFFSTRDRQDVYRCPYSVKTTSPALRN